MTIVGFPPVESANQDGLLAVGGNLDIGSLTLAYSQGIFPWPISEELPMAWFSPDPRGVLKFKNLKVNRRLLRDFRKSQFRIEFNNRFEEVIRTCASAPRRDQENTWISEEIIQAYLSFHKAQFAYSVEVLNPQDQLVGGLYGVLTNGSVSGESMFYKESNASKFALYSLVKHLEQHDFSWIDTQMVTPVVKNMGGSEIPRSEFIKMLKKNSPISFSCLFSN